MLQHLECQLIHSWVHGNGMLQQSWEEECFLGICDTCLKYFLCLKDSLKLTKVQQSSVFATMCCLASTNLQTWPQGATFFFLKSSHFDKSKQHDVFVGGRDLLGAMLQQISLLRNMSVICCCVARVMNLCAVFCVADSHVLQDAFLWNSMGMHTCSVWHSNSVLNGAVALIVFLMFFNPLFAIP